MWLRQVLVRLFPWVHRDRVDRDVSRELAKLALVMREGLALALAGMVLGLGGAFLMTRALASLLQDVAPTNGVSFLTAAGCLLLVTLAASYVPARRATRVDPMAALRAE